MLFVGFVQGTSYGRFLFICCMVCDVVFAIGCIVLILFAMMFVVMKRGCRQTDLVLRLPFVSGLFSHT